MRIPAISMALTLCCSACASGGDGGTDDGFDVAEGGAAADGGGGSTADGSTTSSDAGSGADTGSTQGTLDAGIDAPTASGADSSVTGHKTIFVTSAVYSGNLGGLAGADSDCQALATAAGLGGTYKAWLSDGTTTAAARVTHSSGAYVLVDGTVIASNWSVLASGTLQSPIDKTEQNGAPAAGTASGQACFGLACAWTDTNADGTLAQGSYSCSNWSSESANDNAVLGETTSTSPYWSSFATSSGICELTAPLYCVEQ
jgi:Protein of unknown function (DUF1554)